MLEHINIPVQRHRVCNTQESGAQDNRTFYETIWCVQGWLVKDYSIFLCQLGCTFTLSMQALKMLFATSRQKPHLNKVMSHGGGDVNATSEAVSGLWQFTFTQQLSSFLKVGFPAPGRHVNRNVSERNAIKKTTLASRVEFNCSCCRHNIDFRGWKENTGDIVEWQKRGTMYINHNSDTVNLNDIEIACCSPSQNIFLMDTKLLLSLGEYSLSASLFHFLFRRQIASIKHQDGFNWEIQQHIHKLHAVPHISRKTNNKREDIVQWSVSCSLNMCCFPENDRRAYWSVGSPLASFSAQEKAPLCSQQYVSTATVWPLYFLMLTGSAASLRNCNSPDIPILSFTTLITNLGGKGRNSQSDSSRGQTHCNNYQLHHRCVVHEANNGENFLELEVNNADSG